MSDDPNRTNEPDLDGIVKAVKQELDPDGAGYHTDEAANLIFHKARQACTGHIANAFAKLARYGAVVAIKDYVSLYIDPPSTTRSDAEKAAAGSVGMGQRDFSEEAPGFDWVWQEIALSEGKSPVRKFYGQLTFSEAKSVYDMLLKKSKETLASAQRIRTVLEQHPEWEDNPTWSMSRMLGLKPPRR